jgi:hypothetical protein
MNEPMPIRCDQADGGQRRFAVPFANSVTGVDRAPSGLPRRGWRSLRLGGKPLALGARA